MPGVRRLPHYRDFASCFAAPTSLLATRSPSAANDPDLAEREDILSMLVAAEFDDGSRMDDAELRDQLMTLLLAGHETTATGLAWTFDLLLHTPDVMQRLLAELDDGSTGYLDAVITESLRLRPVVPMTGRLLKQRAELGGFELPAGTVVMAAIYMAHTDPDIYPEPVRLPPRAIRRRRARHLLLDSLRRRHPALHRRRLRRSSRCGSRCARSSARSRCAPRTPSPSG